MKYPQLVSMPSAVSDWLEEQLEARGIDAVVYTRYVLSLLYRDPADVICPEQDFHVTQPNKEVRRIGGGRKRIRRSTDWWGHSKEDAEEIKKIAAVECLLSAADQNCGIESLVDELCIKLKEANKSSTNSEKSPKKNSENRILSPQDLANQYYKAFPPLNPNSTPPSIAIMPKWFDSSQKISKKNRTPSYEDKLHKNDIRTLNFTRHQYYCHKRDIAESMAEWRVIKEKLTARVNQVWNERLGLSVIPDEVKEAINTACYRENLETYYKLPIDIRELFDSPTPEDYFVQRKNLENSRETGTNYGQSSSAEIYNFSSTPGVGNIGELVSKCSSIQHEEQSSSNPATSLPDVDNNIFKELSIGICPWKSVPFLSKWSEAESNDEQEHEDKEEHEDEQEYYYDQELYYEQELYYAQELIDEHEDDGDDEDEEDEDDDKEDDDVDVDEDGLNDESEPVHEPVHAPEHEPEPVSLNRITGPRELYHDVKSSSFARYQRPENYALLRLVQEKRNMDVKVASEQMVDFLTPSCSQFKPITERPDAVFADGTTFVIPNNLDKVCYKQDENGQCYLVDEFGTRCIYREYKTAHNANCSFIPKYKVIENDDGCQTNLEPEAEFDWNIFACITVYDDDFLDEVLDSPDRSESTCKKCIDYMFKRDLSLEEEAKSADLLLEEEAKIKECKCNNGSEQAMKLEYSPYSDTDCPVHWTQPDNVSSETIANYLECERCNKKIDYLSFSDIETAKIWKRNICLDCYKVDAEKRYIKRNPSSANLDKEWDDLNRQLSAYIFHKEYNEKNEENNSVSADTKNYSSGAGYQHFSFASTLEKDCMRKRSSDPTLLPSVKTL